MAAMKDLFEDMQQEALERAYFEAEQLSKLRSETKRLIDDPFARKKTKKGTYGYSNNSENIDDSFDTSVLTSVWR
jgi:hypothetical protein